jgi:hypothetical protein
MANSWKFWNDTLKPKGKYELKRALAVQGFNFGILYVFMPFFKADFQVIEAVVITLFGFVAACIGIAVNEKIKLDSLTNKEEQL